jgi:hypothetical protein
MNLLPTITLKAGDFDEHEGGIKGQRDRFSIPA